MTVQEAEGMKSGVNSDWDVIDGHHLARVWTFRDFESALDFVNAAWRQNCVEALKRNAFARQCFVCAKTLMFNTCCSMCPLQLSSIRIATLDRNSSFECRLE